MRLIHLASINTHEINEGMLHFFQLEITEVEIIKQINTELFPISYQNNYYDHIFTQGNCNYLVYMNNELIGCVSFNIEGKQVYFYTFGILPNFRLCGIGSAVLIELENFLRASFDCQSFILHVHLCNYRALQFYLKNGYRIKSVLESYYSDMDVSSAYLLGKDL